MACVAPAPRYRIVWPDGFSPFDAHRWLVGRDAPPAITAHEAGMRVAAEYWRRLGRADRDGLYTAYQVERAGLAHSDSSCSQTERCPVGVVTVPEPETELRGRLVEATKHALYVAYGLPPNEKASVYILDAILAALRDPDEAMTRAGDTAEYDCSEGVLVSQLGVDCATIFRAMIDFVRRDAERPFPPF